MKIFFTCVIITLLSSLTKAVHFSKVENIFEQNATVKAGDVIQCEIKRTNIEQTAINDFHILTQYCQTVDCFTYLPVSETKCFSFKVRAQTNAVILLSSTPYYVHADRIDVGLEISKEYSAIRTANKHLMTLKKSGLVNDRNYSGFWIRWLDDELLEVGHESEIDPFLYYRFSKKLQFNYVGIMAWTSRGAWIIDGHPKCPSRNGTEVQRKMKAESDCFILH